MTNNQFTFFIGMIVMIAMLGAFANYYGYSELYYGLMIVEVGLFLWIWWVIKRGKYV